jgi:regulatory protein
MLARRELSEAQVRGRLERLGHDPEAIADAVARLKANRSIDDARVAGAIARMEVGLRRRGERRVRQRLQAAGIGGDTAERAVAEVFAELDVDALLAAAVDRRLGGRALGADRRELGRLYRHLVGQGFDGEQVMKALRARQARGPGDGPGDAGA